MKIVTSSKNVDLRFVCEHTALIMLDEHMDDEFVDVFNEHGKKIFCVSFGALKKLREMANNCQRINENYHARRAALHADQLAIGGGPG